MTLAHTEVGNPHHPTLVLLHAGGLSSQMWLPMQRAWAGQYRCLVPELAAPTLPALTQSVLTLLQEATPPVILIGSSLGANVALQIAVQRPDLVRGLILDSVQVGGKALPRPIVGLISLVSKIFPKRLYVQAIMGQFKSYPATDQDLVRADLQRLGAGAFIQAIRLTGQHDVRDTIKTLTMPILLTNGPKDPLIKEAQTLQATLPHAEHFIFAKGSHSALLNQPTVFIEQATGFLARLNVGQ